MGPWLHWTFPGEPVTAIAEKLAAFHLLLRRLLDFVCFLAKGCLPG